MRAYCFLLKEPIAYECLKAYMNQIKDLLPKDYNKQKLKSGEDIKIVQKEIEKEDENLKK